MWSNVPAVEITVTDAQEAFDGHSSQSEMRQSANQYHTKPVEVAHVFLWEKTEKGLTENGKGRSKSGEFEGKLL